MKVENVPGQFGFHVAVRVKPIDDQKSVERKVWALVPGYYLTKEDVLTDFSDEKFEVMWPVEVNDNGSIYIPDKSELQ